MARGRLSAWCGRKNGKPLIVSVYITQTEATLAQSNAAIARIGKAIFAAAR